MQLSETLIFNQKQLTVNTGDRFHVNHKFPLPETLNLCFSQFSNIRYNQTILTHAKTI